MLPSYVSYCTAISSSQKVLRCAALVCSSRVLLRYIGGESYWYLKGLAFIRCKCLFRQRESARIKGEAALAAGEAGAAAQHFSKAVGVTHDMAYQLIKVIGTSVTITLYDTPGNSRQHGSWYRISCRMKNINIEAWQG